MMKNQLKQFLIAGAVLAVLAALFFGWRSWYYRPQTLADILPLSPEDIEACDVQMDYSDRENALCFDLTTGQFHELLEDVYKRQALDQESPPSHSLSN